MVNKEEQGLHGAWGLVSVETRDEKGELVRRGERTGYLIYSPDGYMSVSFMKEGRPVFKSGDIRAGTRSKRTPWFTT